MPIISKKISFNDIGDLRRYLTVELIDTKEAASILGCSVQNVINLANKGTIRPVIRLAKSTVFLKEEIEEYSRQQGKWVLDRRLQPPSPRKIAGFTGEELYACPKCLSEERRTFMEFREDEKSYVCPNCEGEFWYSRDNMSPSGMYRLEQRKSIPNNRSGGRSKGRAKPAKRRPLNDFYNN